MQMRKGWYRTLASWDRHFESRNGMVFVRDVDIDGYFIVLNNSGKFHPSWGKFLVRCSVKEYVTKLNN